MKRPSSTYRLQLNADFGFGAAAALTDYLSRLGVGDAYLSPIFTARPGSAHGYDVADPTRVSEALGGDAGLGELSEALRAHGMGLLLDIVPNHMVAAACNPWWRDVLRNGRKSRYANYFDIDWGEEDRLLLPVLGRSLGQALEAGEIEVERRGDEPELRYFDHAFPLSAESRALLGREPDVGAARLVGLQHYKLAHWREGARRVNYRRFFDVSDLAGVRVEDEAVFEATHARLRELVEEGIVTGVRVDHIDGLRDPAEYLLRLQERVFGGEHWYVVVEKILESSEQLPGDWPVEGTTGYDFLNVLNGLFVEATSLRELSRIYAAFTHSSESFADVVFERKLQVQDELFGAELDRLVRAAEPLTDLEADELRPALAAVSAALPRYRTYFARDRMREEDRRIVAAAVEEARRRRPDPGRVAYDALDRLLALRGHSPPDVPAAELDVVMRWQQYTGPVMAKGHEDTALYVYNRLTSANAVGGDPADPASSPDEFHRLCRRRTRTPGAMNATSTHDSKRSEDVRARINVLSEVPERWRETLARWRELNAPLRSRVGDVDVPDPAAEMLAYQTVVGAWPLRRDEEADFGERLRDYMLKAAREAKTQTSWMEPDEAYEKALGRWVDALLDAEHGFVDDARELCAFTSFHGALDSLAQVLIKAMAPGVPDFYQGTELWDFSLVDPDNRRPVDFERRSRMLGALEPRLREPAPDAARELWRDWKSGHAKLYVTAALLRDRRANAELYREGEHLPLEREGDRAAHACSFARRHGGEWRMALAPLRLVALRPDDAHELWPSGDDGWRGTRVMLPSDAPGSWRDLLTGRTLEARDGAIDLADTFADFPLAALEAR